MHPTLQNGSGNDEANKHPEMPLRTGSGTNEQPIRKPPEADVDEAYGGNLLRMCGKTNPVDRNMPSVRLVFRSCQSLSLLPVDFHSTKYSFLHPSNAIQFFPCIFPIGTTV